MKKVYLLLTALCLTALTGCVKEEPYTLSEATIEVNLSTRSGTVSEQQGDRIEDVMIWVFKGTNWETLAGWRTYTPPTDAFAHTSLTLHIPVALCDGDEETYRLVAVLNKNHWGTDLGLSSETTYAELTSMTFANQALIEQAIEENMPGTPATMPVSHWCDVEVTKANTHASGNCAQATLDVFRAVAKTQLFVSKASNDFNLVIESATLSSSNAPTEGMLLSSVEAADLKAPNVAPDWFGTNAPEQFKADFSQSLKNTTTPAATEGGQPTYSFTAVSLPKPTEDNTNPAYEDVWAGSLFLYENAADGRVTDYANYDYKTNPSTATDYNDYYYMQINYKIDGKPYTGYVPLPAAVRNHDYQVHLTVEGGGKLDLTLKVNEWQEKEETHNYLNEVSVPQDGQIQWTSLPSGATNSGGVVTLGNAGNLQATCKFFLNTPANGTWQAELVTVEGQEGAFTFVDADGNSIGSTTSGPIAGYDTPATLKIKTTRDNLAINGAVSENKVELRITATATVGGVKRTYKVTGLTGIPDVDYYTIVQTR